MKKIYSMQTVDVFYAILDKKTDEVLIDLFGLIWDAASFLYDNETVPIGSSARFGTFEEAELIRHKIHARFLTHTPEEELDFKVIKIEEKIKTESIVDWAEVFLGDLRDT
jgi:hypothetical protein